MKKLSFASLLIGAVLFSACNGNSTNTDTSDSTTTTVTNDNPNTLNDTATMGMSDTNNTANTEIKDDIKDFMKKAAEGGMMEVDLGNIAMKNSSTQQIKDFGKMMVDDHSQVNQELKALASVKNIGLPTMVGSDKQDKIDKLSKENGAEFDKDYVSMMIDDHKKDIDEFKDAQDKANDPDIKAFLDKTIPVLQKHLDAIQAIDKKM